MEAKMRLYSISEQCSEVLVCFQWPNFHYPKKPSCLDFNISVNKTSLLFVFPEVMVDCSESSVICFSMIS